MTEFTCAADCATMPAELTGLATQGEARLDENYMKTFQNLDPATMGCPERCAYAASDGLKGNLTVLLGDENHCVGAFDPLRPPELVTHYYCDHSDNRHAVTWEAKPQTASEFLIYLNHFPGQDSEAKFMGKTGGTRFEFEYGDRYEADAIVGGMNRWDPFPQAGVSACNAYDICTPVVYGELGDCGPAPDPSVPGR